MKSNKRRIDTALARLCKNNKASYTAITAAVLSSHERRERRLVRAASALLSRIDHLTTEEYGRGGDRVEREALKKVLASYRGKEKAT